MQSKFIQQICALALNCINTQSTSLMSVSVRWWLGIDSTHLSRRENRACHMMLGCTRQTLPMPRCIEWNCNPAETYLHPSHTIDQGCWIDWFAPSGAEVALFCSTAICLILASWETFVVGYMLVYIWCNLCLKILLKFAKRDCKMCCLLKRLDLLPKDLLWVSWVNKSVSQYVDVKN